MDLKLHSIGSSFYHQENNKVNIEISLQLWQQSEQQIKEYKFLFKIFSPFPTSPSPLLARPRRRRRLPGLGLAPRLRQRRRSGAREVGAGHQHGRFGAGDRLAEPHLSAEAGQPNRRCHEEGWRGLSYIKKNNKNKKNKNFSERVKLLFKLSLTLFVICYIKITSIGKYLSLLLYSGGPGRKVFK